MDLSDGLGTDLPRLLAESGVAAEVDVDRVPLDSSTRAVAAALGGDPVAWATGGGEDYELLLACEAPAFDRLQQGLADACGTRLTAIGTITVGGPAVRWASRGRTVAVAPGFQHFIARPAAGGARA
jgi:thiamine-monophosphate kinase